MAEDVTKRLEDLNKKVKDFETQKIRAEQELEILKKQYNDLLEELKQYGITNVDNLPELIAKLETELEQKLTDAETEVDKTEEKIAAL
ncbi:MAG: hypothetical protein WC346_21145 [Methanogenium sp.]|jgi:predicted  nucleic acid-binding Zn-ribbon protein